MSFWQENVIVIVILLRILARMLPLEDTSYKGFIIVQLGDSLTSYNQHNSANFGGAKEVQWLYLWRLLFENSWKNLKSNLVLVESKRSLISPRTIMGWSGSVKWGNFNSSPISNTIRGSKFWFLFFHFHFFIFPVPCARCCSLFSDTF